MAKNSLSGWEPPHPWRRLRGYDTWEAPNGVCLSWIWTRPPPHWRLEVGAGGPVKRFPSLEEALARFDACYARVVLEEPG
jgi:hypothetical protein